MKRLPYLAAAAFAAGTTVAQPLTFKDDVPMHAYLDALAQISPPARQAADHYAQAFRDRCGRAMTARELRRAFAEGTGEPVLMRMIRASSLNDRNALHALSASVPCPRDR